MDTPGGVKTGRQKSTFSPTENSYGLVQVKPQDVSSTKTTDPPCFPFHAAVYIRLKSLFATHFFYIFFFAKYIIVGHLFKNIHPSLQYSSHSRIHTSLYDLFPHMYIPHYASSPWLQCAQFSFFFSFFFIAFHNNY